MSEKTFEKVINGFGTLLGILILIFVVITLAS